MMEKTKRIGLMVITALLGIILGGILFSDSQPRSVIAIGRCQGTCLEANEIMGLMASVGVQRFPGVVPDVIRETDKTIAFISPVKLAPFHVLVIPKKDIKNIAEVSPLETEYLVDSYAVMADIIREKSLKDYQIFTNGPGIQHVTYLHFHLMAQETN